VRLALLLALTLALPSAAAPPLTVRFLVGQAKVSRNGGPLVPLKVGDTLRGGDAVKTYDGSRVALSAPGGGIGHFRATLGPQSKVGIDTLTNQLHVEYGSVHAVPTGTSYRVRAGTIGCGMMGPGQAEILVTHVPRKDFQAFMVRKGALMCSEGPPGALSYTVPTGKSLGRKRGAIKLIDLTDTSWHRSYRLVAMPDGPVGETPGTRNLARSRGPTRTMQAIRIPDPGRGRRSVRRTLRSVDWRVCEQECRDLPWCRAWSLAPTLGGGFGGGAFGMVPNCDLMDHVPPLVRGQPAGNATGVLRPVSHEYAPPLVKETILRDPISRRGVRVHAPGGFDWATKSKRVTIRGTYGRVGDLGDPGDCEAACRKNPHCQMMEFRQGHRDAKNIWWGPNCVLLYEVVPTRPAPHFEVVYVRSRP